MCARVCFCALAPGTRAFKACNHQRAYKYYSDSILNRSGFTGYPCDDQFTFESVSSTGVCVYSICIECIQYVQVLSTVCGYGSVCWSVCGVCVCVCVCVCESGGLSLCESTLWLTRGDDLSCAEERAGGLACRGGHSPAKKDHDNQGVLWLHERGGSRIWGAALGGAESRVLQLYD